MRKVVVVFDTTREKNDKNWMVKTVSRFCESKGSLFDSVYCISCLSEMFNKNIFSRIWVRIDVFFALIKVILKTKPNDIIVFWSPYMATFYYALTRNLLHRNVISMGWLKPYRNRRFIIEKKMFSSNNYTFITKNSVARRQLLETYSSSANVLIFPDVINMKEQIKAPVVKEKKTIFMGGRSNRDWNEFLQYAKMLPDYQFCGCASSRDWTKNLDEAMPSNVKMFFDLKLEKYNELLEQSHLVLLLMDDLESTSGLITVIRASQWGKISISTKMDSVDMYYEPSIKHMCLVNKGGFEINKIDELMRLNTEEYIDIASKQQNYILSNFSEDSFFDFLCTNEAFFS